MAGTSEGAAPEGPRMVSVVIPVYNRVTLLPRAVESVLHQRVPDTWALELVIVDDDSSDGSGEYASALAARDPRVTAVRIRRSGFPGAVRNRGVEIASGEIVAFLDSDDLWLPGKVERQLPLHDLSAPEATRCRLSHTRERWNRDGRIVSQGSQRHRRDGDIFHDALWKCIIGPSTVMVDREFFLKHGGFREDLEVAEDYELWLRLLCHTDVAYVDQECTEKRAGPWEQLSEKYGQIEGFRIAALTELVDGDYFGRHRSGEDRDAARTVLARKLEIFAAGARKRGRHGEAEQLEQAAKLYR
jgi:glycosyltransferase involved in cell wall biosynthesis